MDAATSPAVVIAVAALPVVACLGELLIQWARSRVERARQAVAWKMILVMKPGSLAVMQQPDGTATVLVYEPVVNVESSTGGEPREPG